MRPFHAVSVIVALFLMAAASAQTYGQAATAAATPGATAETKLENFDAAKFDNPTDINNKWFPLKPGTQWVYEGHTEDNGKVSPHRVMFTVTDLTKVIAGLKTVVVWEQDFSEGQLVESEIVFFAQDNDGAVWQLGQYPEVYENGKVTESPAWIHGIKDARAGIVMQAKSQPGTPSYSQGWGPAVDYTDRGQVEKVGQETCVAAGCYKDVLVIKEWSLDEPNAFQYKYYAQDVGNILVDWGGADRTKEKLELMKVDQLSPDALATARADALKLERSAYEISKEVYGLTAPSLAPGQSVQATPPAATKAATAQGTQSASAAGAAKFGHWEGKVSRTDGDIIMFDVMDSGEVDNIEVELTVSGAKCVAEIEITLLNPDGTFMLAATPTTNGIRAKFSSQTTASGTVTLHDCGGNPVPATAGKDEYNWTAEWVSDKVG
jgi:hypothetical protein